MSRKIIGVTVGTTLPKPNFKQTDPTKGDYIKNKPDFEGLKNQVSDIGEQIDTAVNTLEEKISAKADSEHTHLAITDEEIDEICGGGMVAFFETISSEGECF